MIVILMVSMMAQEDVCMMRAAVLQATQSRMSAVHRELSTVMIMGILILTLILLIISAEIAITERAVTQMVTLLLLLTIVSVITVMLMVLMMAQETASGMRSALLLEYSHRLRTVLLAALIAMMILSHLAILSVTLMSPALAAAMSLQVKKSASDLAVML